MAGIVVGFFIGILYAYIEFGVTGKGWSLYELMRDIRWMFEYDIFPLPIKFWEWVKRH
jgi:hypothetical protein